MIDNPWHRHHHGITMEYSVLINRHYPVTPTSFLLQRKLHRPGAARPVRRQASRVAA